MANTGQEGGAEPPNAPSTAWYSLPLEILNQARQAVPAVDYALGVAGIAAAGALVVGLLGYNRAAVIIGGFMLVAMILLLIFSKLTASPSFHVAGLVLVWAVTLFAVAFLTFTVTAFAVSFPKPWAAFLGIELPTPTPGDGAPGTVGKGTELKPISESPPLGECWGGAGTIGVTEVFQVGYDRNSCVKSNPRSEVSYQDETETPGKTKKVLWFVFDASGEVAVQCYCLR